MAFFPRFVLPIKSKPKCSRKTPEQKRVVVLGPHERKTYQLLQQLNTIRNDQSKKRSAQEVRVHGWGGE